MRKKFLGANWKMNLAYQKSKDLYTELSSLSPPSSEVVIFPSTLFLSEFASLNGLPLGAQDVHFETYRMHEYKICIRAIINLLEHIIKTPLSNFR